MASNRLWKDRAQKIVVLDSSAIMMLFEFSIDLEDELIRLLGRCKIIVPKPIIDELTYLSENGKGKKKTNAKASLKLIEKIALLHMTMHHKIRVSTPRGVDKSDFEYEILMRRGVVYEQACESNCVFLLCYVPGNNLEPH